MTPEQRILLLLIFASSLLVSCSEGQLNSKDGEVRRTVPSLANKNDLWCYQCDTVGEGDMCIHLNSTGNETSLAQKCKQDKRTCMVKRYSYTTSTENSTSMPKLWGMERNCTSKCEPGCIVIGERTKLYACTTCCDKSYCNNGNSADHLCAKEIDIFLALVLQIVPAILLSFSSS